MKDSRSARHGRLMTVLAVSLFVAIALPGTASAAISHTFNSGALTVSSDGGDAITIDCFSGSVQVNGSTTGYPACSQVNSLTVNGGNVANNINLSAVTRAKFANLGPVTINANGGDDTSDGSQLVDTINGGTGMDTLRGHADNDLLQDGGNEAHTVDGGDGNDKLNVTSTNFSVFTVNADVIQTDFSDWSYANLELVEVVLDPNQDSGAGAALATTAVKATGANVKNNNFVTGPFDDTFDGKGAAIGDGIFAQTDSPTLTLTNSSLTGTSVGTDTLIDLEVAGFSSVGGDVDNVWNASAWTRGPLTMSSGLGDDTLIGTPQAEVNPGLDGGDDDDVLTGLGGNDYLAGGNGRDTARETGVTSATVNSGGMSTNHGNDTFAGGMEAVDLTGTASNETLTLNTFAGDARLDGAGGADTLTSKGGADELIGGDGVDDFSAGAGPDVIRAQDGAADGTITCGSEQDVAFVDPEDKVESDCETRTLPPPPGGGGDPGGDGTVPGNTTSVIAQLVDAVAPSVTGLAFSSRSFRAANRGGSIAAAVGSTVSYRLSEAATAGFTVEHAAQGRRVGRRCAAPSPRNRRGRRCTRYVRVRGAFSHPGRTGTNSFRFTGRVGGRKLSPGRYRLVMVATDAAGNRSRTGRAGFRIVRR